MAILPLFALYYAELWGVVTANIIRELFQGVVASYKEGLTFYSKWSPTLDSSGDEHNPKVVWVEPRVELVPNDNGTQTQNFILNVLFLDQTAQDRSPTVRDLTYERMQIVAAHVWARFRELYVNEDDAIYQGVNVALEQTAPATFTAVWDTPGEMTTGCGMVVTVSSHYQFCAANYFNA